jgi:hypothetical protein
MELLDGFLSWATYVALLVLEADSCGEGGEYGLDVEPGLANEVVEEGFLIEHGGWQGIRNPVEAIHGHANGLEAVPRVFGRTCLKTPV